MFKKREENEWNLWEEDTETFKEKKHNQKTFSFHKVKKNQDSDDKIWDNEDEVNYLDENAHNIYIKDSGFQYSKTKIAIIILVSFLSVIGIVGYMNTDFDETSKGYIINYDLHYERDYVKVSDELYDYCEELKLTLADVMPQLSTNSLSLTNTVSEMKDILVAKTNKVSRYTEVPEIMSTYNDNLISFSLSTQKMLATMLSQYTQTDYLSWAKSAYTDYCNSLQTLEYLRSQINTVIYRNIYGGGNNE